MLSSWQCQKCTGTREGSFVAATDRGVPRHVAFQCRRPVRVVGFHWQCLYAKTSEEDESREGEGFHVEAEGRHVQRVDGMEWWWGDQWWCGLDTLDYMFILRLPCLQVLLKAIYLERVRNFAGQVSPLWRHDNKSDVCSAVAVEMKRKDKTLQGPGS